MRFLREMRALLRFEMRQFSRHRGRSLLVMLLVAAPVAAMVGGGTLFRLSQPTTEEQRTKIMGRSGASLETQDLVQILRVRAELPQHIQSQRVSKQACQLVLGTENRDVVQWSLELPVEFGRSLGLAEGMLELSEGAWPSHATELAVSSQLAHELGVTVGDRLEWKVGDSCSSRIVSGLVRTPEDLSAEFALTNLLNEEQLEGRPAVHWLLTSFPEAAAEDWVAEVQSPNLSAFSRETAVGPDPFATMVIFVGGGLAFFEAALVIAAAFAVGMRRRQREIGLLGATGASPLAVRAALMGSASLLAGLGGLLGIGLGIGLAWCLYPYLEGWSGRVVSSLSFAWTDLLGAAALSLVTAVAAAARPASTAVKLPVLVALSGRRPLTAPASLWGWCGAALVAVGVLLMGWKSQLHEQFSAWVLLLGCTLCVAGLCLLSPWMLERLAHLARPLPLSWRLAVRDAGRFRARNGPVVAAILAAMSLCVLASSFLVSLERFLMEANPESTLAERPGGALFYVAVAFSAGTSLIVVLVATTLSSVESAADARSLHALGCRPSLLRRHVAARACYLALLGSLLAIPGGLLPAFGMTHVSQAPLHFSVPWGQLVLAVTILPIAAYVCMWFLARGTQKKSHAHGGL